ncbi:MAG: hypothetical protein MJ072_02840, partial [Clostridia bacterium]|nr:hypothetical protein [Clostridia bacterium]
MVENLTASERIYNVLHGKETDRLPVMEWAPIWEPTYERWASEGLNVKHDGKKSWREIQLYLGLDANVQTWFGPRTPDCPKPLSFGAGIAKNQSEFNELKRYLYPDPSKIVGKDYFDWLKKTRDEGNTINWFTMDGFFWYPREILGIEEHLYSFYDQPEFYAELCAGYLDWLKKVVEYIGNNFRFDFMTFAEDMSYNNGPMLSKNHFDEFLAPYYKEIIPLIKKLDIPVFIDSDGDITQAVDWYAGVGANGMLPLERKAGVDVSVYLEKHPEMYFLGHFDKTCMKFGEEAMRTEFERLRPSIGTKHL